jgi:hypothetical protein
VKRGERNRGSEQSEARRALSEPRCEQSDERSESCECVSAPRSTTCCASCGKVCASGGAHHGRRRYMREPLLCATTLSSLDAAVVTRRRRRMTSFAFPSGGRAIGRVSTPPSSDALCDDGGQAPSTQTAPTAPTARTAARACRGRRPRWQGLHRNSLARLRRRLRRRRPRLGVPTG